MHPAGYDYYTKETMKIQATLLAVLTLSTAYGNDFDIPRIGVYGTATTHAKPDQLRWVLGVKTTGLDIEKVASEHDKTVSMTLAFLKKQGVTDTDIQTSNVSLDENWDYRGNTRVRDGFFAQTGISFISADLPHYRDMWIGLSQIPGLSVESATWETSRRIVLQDITRVQALEAAKEKAIALAKAIDARIAEPLQIEEVLDDWHSNGLPVNRLALEQASEAGEAIAPGTIPIRMKIYAVFRLESE
jgi:uncharacterized protein YggE